MRFSITDAGPRIFAVIPLGRGAVLIANSATIVEHEREFAGSRPPRRGEFISIYCTGLGAVQASPGPAIAGNPLSKILVTPAPPTAPQPNPDAIGRHIGSRIARTSSKFPRSLSHSVARQSSQPNRSQTMAPVDRRILQFNVTAPPTAQWIGQRL